MSVTPGGDAPRLRASSTEADRRPDVGGDGSAPRCWGSAGAAVGRPITEVRVAALNRDDDEVGRPLGSSTTSVWPAARSISTRGIPTMSTVDEEMGAGQRRAGLENRQQVRTTVEEEERRSVRAYPPDQGLHLDRFSLIGPQSQACPAANLEPFVEKSQSVSMLAGGFARATVLLGRLGQFLNRLRGEAESTQGGESRL